VGTNREGRSEVSDTGAAGASEEKHAVPYWDDPAYRYVARMHRSALAANEGAEAERLAAIMQQFVDGTVRDALYGELEEQARAERRKQRQVRRRQGKRHARVPSEPAPSLNIGVLKKRIFNPHVSRENMIKALESLPAAERSTTIAGLPPGLRRKLGNYLTGRER
jgi:hypothetical protein